MNSKDELYSYALELDKYYSFFTDMVGEKFSNLFNKFIDSIDNQGAIPYVLGENQRYRSSPLATALEHLTYANLLTKSMQEQMQATLYWYRDNAYSNSEANDFPKEKRAEDDKAWCCTEGASVWGTSKALIALFTSDFNYQQTKFNREILDSIEWLIKQQHENGGWGYQLWRNCIPTIPMTALSLKALLLFILSQTDTFFKNFKDKTTMIEIIEKGFDFAINEVKEEGNITYWEFNNRPNIIGTAWMLEVINLCESQRIKDLLNKSYLSTLYEKKKRIQKFLLDELENSFSTEKTTSTELFVSEAGAKYGKHKNFYAFLPSITRILLINGISPTNKTILAIIRYLINNKYEWKIPEYDDKICSFSYAIALSTLILWYRKCCYYNIHYIQHMLINHDSAIINCIYDKHCIETKTLQLKNKNYLIVICLLMCLSLVSWFFLRDSSEFIKELTINSITTLCGIGIGLIIQK